MKYLVHGDDVVVSRKFLSEVTNGFKTTVLDGKSLTVFDFEIAISSQDLFGEKKAVVVENLFSKNKKRSAIVKLLNNYNGLTLVIFWEGEKINKNSTKILKDFNIKEFLLPQNYFLFLDTFAPKNTRNVYGLFEELVRQKGAELVFYSLLKRIRILLVLESGATDVSDLKNLAPWQIARLKNQLKLWPSEKLFHFYSLLQDAEINLKSGRLPISLSKHLDILILSEL